MYGRDSMTKYLRICVALLMCFVLPWTAEAAKNSDAGTQISDLRVSAGADKVRIVLNTKQQVRYKQMTLGNPDRLVVDIENAWVDGKDKTEKDIDSRFASQVRLAQFNENTVRIVIHTKLKGQNVNIFTLDNPNRLVIDLGNLRRSSAGVNIDIKNGKPKDSQKQTEKKEAPKENKTKAKQIALPRPSSDGADDKEAENNKKNGESNKKKSPARDDSDDEDDDFGRGNTVATAQDDDEDDDDDFGSERPKRKPFEFIWPERRSEADYSDTDRAIAELTGLKGRIIAIDPGHGGSDPGAIGPSGVTEKSVTLKVALELRKLLEQEGAKVYMTRTKDTEVSPKGKNATDIEELQARCDIANRCKADVFISIHMDSFTNDEANGTTGYYYTEGSAKSRSLADKIRAGIIEQIHTNSRGTLPRNLYVVKHTDMPATLIEVAFISNRKEEKLMNSDEGVKKAAQGIADGIADYFG